MSIEETEWNKKRVLEEQRREENRAEPPPRLDPPFPWTAIAYDPGFFKSED